MNITLSKYLNNIFKKKQDQGFTLIELLVVIIIIGILAAIATPSLFQHVETSRTAEARQYLGTLNRAQQAHYFENGTFANAFSELGADLTLASNTYNYQIINSNTTEVQQQANPIPPFDNDLKILEGAVFRIGNGFDTSLCIGNVVADDPNITSPTTCNNGQFIK